jgi:SAM-dependent methyltransferase
VNIPDPDHERRRHHFEVERELADRLRAASRVERRALYPVIYAELFRRVEMPDDRPAQRAQVGPLLELVRPFLTPGSGFAEFGAGHCDLSLAVAARADRVWAVDAVVPDLPASEVPANFRFVPAGEVDRLPRSGVDVALSCHFVEHLHPDDLPDHLAEVRRLLRDGGIYVVVTPNRIYGPHDISRGFSDRAQGLHLREYCHHDLAGCLRRAGFVSVGAIGSPGTRPSTGRLRAASTAERVVDALPGAWRRALLALAPRRPPFRPLEQVKLAGVSRVDR